VLQCRYIKPCRSSGHGATVVPARPLFSEAQALSQASSFAQLDVGPLPLTVYSFSVAVANGYQARELAEKVRKVICEQWQGAGGSLHSAVIYQRLLEEGVEVPGYQMSAVLNAFKVGGLIAASLRLQCEEDVREHGDFLITSVHSDLCNSS
jgi:hypothetical protein